MKKKCLFLICIFLFLIIVLYFVYPPITLELIGDEVINLKIGEDYVEPGYKCIFIKEDISSDVLVDGIVDNETVGQYKISYEIKKGLKKINKERVVNIVDDIGPSLVIKGPSHIYLYQGRELPEYGYSVSDNYDQDIEVKIESNLDINTLGEYEIKYIAIDSSNNRVEEVRTVEVINHSIASSIPVLMYHFFYESGNRPDGNYVRRDEFDEQLKYLVDNNFYFPTWEEVDAFLDGIIALPENSIVLTFDDGDPSFYDIAYPVAEKYNVPITAFIITSWGPPNNEWFPLVSFQSHSHDMHQGGCSGQGHGGLFQCLNHDDALADAKLSKEIANDAMVFCYPFGDVNSREVDILKEAGYKMAFTTEWGYIRPGMDKYRLPRIRISGWNSFDYFKDLVS